MELKFEEMLKQQSSRVPQINRGILETNTADGLKIDEKKKQSIVVGKYPVEGLESDTVKAYRCWMVSEQAIRLSKYLKKDKPCHSVTILECGYLMLFARHSSFEESENFSQPSAPSLSLRCSNGMKIE